MKLKQLYNELIKAYLDDKIYNWNYGEDGDNVYLMQNQNVVWIIPKACYPFDNERIFSTPPLRRDPKNLIKTAYDGFELELTPVTISEGKLKLHLLKSEKFDTYVSDQYWKFLVTGTTFRAIDRRSPVFCFEEETLVAMIMPVVRNIRREKNA